VVYARMNGVTPSQPPALRRHPFSWMSVVRANKTIRSET
jgi:hypothetical protein